MAPTILFIMDFQTPIREHAADVGWFDEAAKNAAVLLSAARALGPEKVKIIHAIAASGVDKTNTSLYSVSGESAIGKRFQAFPATLSDPKIVELVAPLPGEQILSRPRVSPFHYTDLNAQLRALGATKLVLCGVATSGIVLATFRSGVDADYDVVVVGEACADVDRVLHDSLVNQCFARLGRVVTVEKARQELSG
ncbi:Isochorismatase hydrolase [Calocera cornea HHB12733]|uniref:Isochorismatase hydrolase n=1 Tax=Calocera cornea HHB12733 TaxID=1353952 RepID=A0A165ESM5_9BASI|nr:Isochorismatase hydrolase [Calocera cornea HHB12733]